MGIPGIEGLATNYPAGTHIAPHAHDAHQIVHGLDGVMRVMAAEGAWFLPPGRALWVPARVSHEIRCPDAVRMRTVYLTGDDPAFPEDVRVAGVSPLMREILVRLAEGAAESELPHLSALLVSEIAASVIEPLHLPAPADVRIARLVAHLSDQPADPATLEDWADRLALSKRSLIRKIRAETGMTFRALRRQVRVIAAVERLARGEPVTRVAYDVGFDSPSAFIQAFRAITGTTPGRYMG